MSDLISWDRKPSAIMLNRRSSLLDNARRGVAPSYGVLTYRGRNFRVVYKGEEVMLRDERRQPVSFLDVVIVGVSPYIGRQYFGRSYSEGDSNAPDCYSTNGEVPDEGVPSRQHPVCATCKWAQWGSRMTDGGKKAKVCQDSKRLAIVPVTDIANEIFGGPLLLRLPAMTIPNFSNYGEFLARKGASFEFVTTRISFDEKVAYPKLVFEAQGFLSDEQLVQSVGADGNSGICADPRIGRILNTSDAPSPAHEDPPAQAPPPTQAPPPEEEEDEPEEETPPPQAAEANPFTKTRAKKAPPAGIAAAPPGMESALNKLFGGNAG